MICNGDDFFYVFFYFYPYISTPDLQENAGGAIHRASIYPDLLSGDTKILLSA